MSRIGPSKSRTLRHVNDREDSKIARIQRHVNDDFEMGEDIEFALPSDEKHFEAARSRRSHGSPLIPDLGPASVRLRKQQNRQRSARLLPERTEQPSERKSDKRRSEGDSAHRTAARARAESDVEAFTAQHHAESESNRPHLVFGGPVGGASASLCRPLWERLRRFKLAQGPRSDVGSWHQLQDQVDLSPGSSFHENPVAHMRHLSFSDCSAFERRILHTMCEHLELGHVSWGEGSQRTLTVFHVPSPTSAPLPSEHHSNVDPVSPPASRLSSPSIAPSSPSSTQAKELEERREQHLLQRQKRQSQLVRPEEPASSLNSDRSDELESWSQDASEIDDHKILQDIVSARRSTAEIASYYPSCGRTLFDILPEEVLVESVLLFLGDGDLACFSGVCRCSFELLHILPLPSLVSGETVASTEQQSLFEGKQRMDNEGDPETTLSCGFASVSTPSQFGVNALWHQMFCRVDPRVMARARTRLKKVEFKLKKVEQQLFRKSKVKRTQPPPQPPFCSADLQVPSVPDPAEFKLSDINWRLHVYQVRRYLYCLDLQTSWCEDRFEELQHAQSKGSHPTFMREPSEFKRGSRRNEEAGCSQCHCHMGLPRKKTRECGCSCHTTEQWQAGVVVYRPSNQQAKRERRERREAELRLLIQLENAP